MAATEGSAVGAIGASERAAVTAGLQLAEVLKPIARASSKYHVEWDSDVFDAPVIRCGEIFVAEFGGKVCWSKPFRMRMAQIACQALNAQFGG